MIKNILEPIGLVIVRGDEQDFIKVENYEARLSEGWCPKMILWGQPRIEDNGAADGLGCLEWRVPEVLREVFEKGKRGEL